MLCDIHHLTCLLCNTSMGGWEGRRVVWEWGVRGRGGGRCSGDQNWGGGRLSL